MSDDMVTLPRGVVERAVGLVRHHPNCTVFDSDELAECSCGAREVREQMRAALAATQQPVSAAALEVRR